MRIYSQSAAFFHRLTAYLRVRCLYLAWLSAVAVLLGQLPFWFAELFSHFLPYYAAVWLLATAVSAGRQRWLWVACTVAALLWLLWPTPASAPQQNAQWRLLWYNVHLDNPDPAAETARILDRQPEILALAEINLDDTRWQALRRAYPHGCEHREASPFALAVWAKQPLVACQVRLLHGIPYIRAEYADTAVYALHPPPPINGELAAVRREYLHITAEQMASENKVLAVGDLNSSAFSPVFHRFQAAAQLNAATPSWLPTWKPFGLGIDHVLTRGITVAAEPLPWLHSDHRPLLVRHY